VKTVVDVVSCFRKMAHVCAWCGVDAAGEAALLHHILTEHAPKPTPSGASSVHPIASSSKSTDAAGLSSVLHVKGGFKCSACEKQYKTRRSLTRHVRESHSGQRHVCSICKESFKSLRTLKQHTSAKHPKLAKFEATQLKCKHSSERFQRQCDAVQHKKKREVRFSPLS